MTVYTTISQFHDVAIRKEADVRRRTERKQRRLQEDLRHALKHRANKIDLEGTYEEVCSYNDTEPRS